jgi:hypothetical protein
LISFFVPCFGFNNVVPPQLHLLGVQNPLS